MVFWWSYLMDEDIPHIENETKGKSGSDRSMTEAIGRGVIPAFLEECCNVDLVPWMAE